MSKNLTQVILSSFLPEGAVIKGSLDFLSRPFLRVVDLVSDMVEIDLPCGETIDVGWVPEHDFSGCYRICLYKDFWDNKVIEDIYVNDISDVLQTIKNIS